jgi:hypothetical protein
VTATADKTAARQGRLFAIIKAFLVSVPGTAGTFSAPVYAGLNEDCPIGPGKDSTPRLQQWWLPT